MTCFADLFFFFQQWCWPGWDTRSRGARYIDNALPYLAARITNQCTQLMPHSPLLTNILEWMIVIGYSINFHMLQLMFRIHRAGEGEGGPLCVNGDRWGEVIISHQVISLFPSLLLFFSHELYLMNSVLYSSLYYLWLFFYCKLFFTCLSFFSIF